MIYYLLFQVINVGVLFLLKCKDGERLVKLFTSQYGDQKIISSKVRLMVIQDIKYLVGKVSVNVALIASGLLLYSHKPDFQKRFFPVEHIRSNFPEYAGKMEVAYFASILTLSAIPQPVIYITSYVLLRVKHHIAELQERVYVVFSDKKYRDISVVDNQNVQDQFSKFIKSYAEEYKKTLRLSS